MINSVLEIFSKTDFFYDLIVHTAAVLITAVLAFVTWLIKNAYDSYVNEMKLLVKIEVYLSRDRASLVDNRDSFGKWLKCLNESRAYTGAMHSYASQEIDFYNVSNLDLLNKLNDLTYRLHRFDTAINHNFSEYRNGINKFFESKDIKADGWESFNKNLLEQLKILQESFNEAIKETESTLAFLRVYKKQRRWSVFRPLKFLNTPIFPCISHKAVEKELKDIQNSTLEKARSDI
jgi:hypothetical protein